ncbi:hypothetical protein Nepgr_022980 [Nepenthes gracilis]|uniref:Uncharacterized protein n=1 Tax=Nepenthes gracilis TaxID=150966 RepID=A0AAD3SZY9_NEPGR|nr:hypothetical protein Nepgr_022980 [Nepenthes gracilis]
MQCLCELGIGISGLLFGGWQGLVSQVVVSWLALRSSHCVAVRDCDSPPLLWNVISPSAVGVKMFADILWNWEMGVIFAVCIIFFETLGCSDAHQGVKWPLIHAVEALCAIFGVSDPCSLGSKSQLMS